MLSFPMESFGNRIMGPTNTSVRKLTRANLSQSITSIQTRGLRGQIRGLRGLAIRYKDPLPPKKKKTKRSKSCSYSLSPYNALLFSFLAFSVLLLNKE